MDEQVATVEALLDEAVNPFQGLETHYVQLGSLPIRVDYGDYVQL